MAAPHRSDPPPGAEAPGMAFVLSEARMSGAGCDVPLAERKARARREALARRLAAAQAAAADPRFAERFAALVLEEAPPPRGALIAGFWSMGPEIDVRLLLKALEARGHALALPVTPRRGLPLLFRRWRWGEPLGRGPLGTRQPEAGEVVRPDFLLVPLLAFDRAGRRLGYGGGYYDRTLAALPGAVALGCAYAAQEVAKVPAGPEDARLARVATEEGVVVCGRDGPG